MWIFWCAREKPLVSFPGRIGLSTLQLAVTRPRVFFFLSLSVYISSLNFVYISFCLSFDLFVCLFLHRSVCLPICLSVHRSVCLLIYLYISIILFHSLALSTSIFLSLSLSLPSSLTTPPFLPFFEMPLAPAPRPLITQTIMTRSLSLPPPPLRPFFRQNNKSFHKSRRERERARERSGVPHRTRRNLGRNEARPRSRWRHFPNRLRLV